MIGGAVFTSIRISKKINPDKKPKNNWFHLPSRCGIENKNCLCKLTKSHTGTHECQCGITWFDENSICSVCKREKGIVNISGELRCTGCMWYDQ